MDPAAGIAASVDRMNRELGKVTRDVVRAGAQDVARALVESARAKGRGHMSGLRWKAAVRVKLETSTGAGAVAVGRPNNAGAWAIADKGAGPHLIRSASGKHLTIGGDRQVLEVHHPGVRGTGAWTQGLAGAGAELDAKIDRAVAAAFAEEFG